MRLVAKKKRVVFREMIGIRAVEEACHIDNDHPLRFIFEGEYGAG
jgi:hypothetical protein